MVSSSSGLRTLTSWLLVCLVLMPSPVHLVVNMYENEAEIEVVDKSNFDSVIYGSDKASFVEFYAHWCGACKRYKPLILEIAKSTRAWHSKVMRVAVINCGDSFNDEFCRKHNIHHYPTLKLFPAQGAYNEEADHGGSVLQLDSAEQIIGKMVEFVEKQQTDKSAAKPPVSWPDLTPFVSKRFDTLFIPNKELRFAVLIVEKDDSNLGKKLILDFSAYSDRLIIRRTTPSSNPSLLVKLDTDTRKLPLVYIVNNTKSSEHGVNTAPAELLTEALVKRYKDRVSVDFEDDDDGDAQLTGNDHDNKDRARFNRLIRSFIKTNSLLSKDEDEKLKEHANAVNEHREKMKKEESDVFLTNIKDKVYMQDLEAGLNLLIRSDIAHSKLISGKKLAALREWINLLANYFPGRKPVRNYLKNLNIKLNSSQITEITGNQWKLIADENTATSFLPNTTDWKHCLGSESKFRGYPCSLWTIFHVLTVNQVELEKEKPRPFENFNVKEVIEGIRSFVTNFFTCRECAENFERETHDYMRSLSKTYDAVQYLWTVHNRVNRRLEHDQIIENDPKFPKRQFPSQEQCPNCYLPAVKNADELADHEAPWNTRECLLFLTSYYSRYQIVPIDGEVVGKQQIAAPIDGGEAADPEIDEGHPIQPEIDEPKAPDAVIDRIPLDANENKRDGEPQLAAKAIPKPNIEPVKLESDLLVEKQSSSDLKLAFIFGLIAFTSFGFLFIYFNYLRRSGNKAKKHII